MGPSFKKGPPMTPTPRPPRRGDLQHSQHLDVRLTRAAADGPWRGEVCRPGTGDRLCFLTLPALLAWIEALEPGAVRLASPRASP